MLKIIRDLRGLSISQLFKVYHETIVHEGQERYPDLQQSLQIIQAEQDFYAYLKLFFRDPQSFYAIWETENAYKAALRIEPYKDGVIVSALETAPEARRRGYACSLLRETIAYLRQQGIKVVYSHINKNNIASLRTHKRCGFTVCMDHAAYLDGSVFTDACTVCLNLIGKTT